MKELLRHAIERPINTIEVLRLLINRGTPLNTIMYENYEASRRLYPFIEFGTPLHKAAEMGKIDVIRHLLERGPNIDIKNTKGYILRSSVQ